MALMAVLRYPRLQPHFVPLITPGEGVLLLNEKVARVLRGDLYERLIPLLDGTRSADQLVQALTPEFSAAQVYFTLISLQSRNYLCQALTTLSPEAAAYWADLGLDPEQAVGLIQASRVALKPVGLPNDHSSLQQMGQALVSLGLAVVDVDAEADLTVVVCENYLHPDLDALNQSYRRQGRRWLLVKPHGRELWLGPFFDPKQPGCWACLQRLLVRQRQVERFAAALTKTSLDQISRPLQAPGGAVVACHWSALEVARILAGVSPQTANHVVSFNLVDYSSGRHALVVDPHCPACGCPVEPRSEPIALQPCKVRFDHDGGHRHVSAAETLERYGGLISPITGIVSELRSVPSSLTSAHVVVAGQNPAQMLESFNDLRRNLRSSASGKGASLEQARASALAEALERFCAEDHPGVPRERGSVREMQRRYGDAVILPNDVMHFSEQQFAERDHWNAKGSRFNRVPMPLDHDQEIDWTPIWSISRQRLCFLPTQLLMMVRGRSRDVKGEDADPWIAMGCSNGNAAGNTLEEAVLQGFMELVERDSVAIWWYNRLKRPGIDLASCKDAWITRLIHDYNTIGRDVWALDLTTDLGITSVVALSRNRDGDAERILMGLGCHLDPRIAVQRALAEMNQMLGIADADLEGPADALDDWETLEWLKTATLLNQPYLLPDSDAPLRRVDTLADHHSGDLLHDIQHCCACVEAQGLEVLVLDQTRELVGLPVVKVVVPGLRHFWARYGAGRLYDVPVRMGQLPLPLAEEQLNPIPIFF
ncbi:TOMM precursor leader peptide-binding protein [bacterium]|nr:TOMM precursor leader peptide-binding protein [bacterium]